MNKNAVGIVNYGAGNIFSLTAALNRQNIPFGMVNNEEDLESFHRIIIPGVGHAAAAMAKLKHHHLITALQALTKPVLGICLGMQLLTEHSAEGNIALLNKIPLQTRDFARTISLKVPHMGWNTINIEKHNPIFIGMDDNQYFYFVHSYFVEYNPTFTSATCNYGTVFSAAIQNDNFFGLQFHPEKSGRMGEKLLKNFSNI